MEVPDNAIKLATTFEGFYAKAYLCPAGLPTIGYGHLVKSLNVPPVTKSQAETYLAQDLQDALLGTIRYCPELLVQDENRLGAIVDFVFNLGAGRLKVSTLRKKINAQEWVAVPHELNKWVYGGGKRLKGLVLRRQAEAAYFS